MFYDLASFVIFVLVTTITPGPNNISSLTFCLHQGLRKTIPYMLGIISGVFCVEVMIASTLFYFSSTSIAEFFGWLKYLGAAYILYLAYKTFMLNINWQGDDSVAKSRYWDGLILQSVNPKVYFFSLTIFTTFVDFSKVEYWQLVVLAMTLTSLTFLAILIWGAVGALLKKLLQNRVYVRIFSALMSLGLVYTAYRILVP